MVVKKRCDFCLKIKQYNVQAEEKVFNRELKDVLTKVAGVEPTSEQLSNILTCSECAIAILQAEPIVVKARTLLTRLSKQKIKRKTTPGQPNGDVNTNQSLLDQSIALGDDDSQVEEEDAKNNPTPIPKKVTARRKSVAKKLVESLINDELEGSPAASSTMAVNTSIIGNKATPKPTPKRKPKANPKSKSTKSTEKFNLGGNSQEETNQNDALQKATKDKSSEKSENLEQQINEDDVLQKPTKDKVSEKFENLQQDNNDLFATPMKAESAQSIAASPKKMAKRSISERSDTNSQEESTEMIMPFKKMKETPSATSIKNSQESSGGDKVVKECFDCGKTFLHLDRYESHVFSQKCKLAAYACKHPDCSRRFFKLHKMLEHMQKKHPDMDETEMD